MRIRRRGQVWTVLGLLLGALAVLLRPAGRAPIERLPVVMAAGAAASRVAADNAVTPTTVRCEPGRPTFLPATEHGWWCRPHVSAARPGMFRSPSWHRGTSRRQQRDSHAALAAAQITGSIPVAEPLYGERVAGYARIGAPPHAAGRLVIASRAPPALN